MVLLYYYDQRGSDCLAMLKHEKFPTKVQLHPFEGWASPSLNVVWLIEPCRFSRNKVLVTEVYGGVRNWTTVGKLRFADDDPSTIYVIGRRRVPKPNASVRAKVKPKAKLKTKAKAIEATLSLRHELASRLDSLFGQFLPGRRLRHYTPLHVTGDSEREADESPEANVEKLDFRLTLSTKVSDTDFRLGYCVAGTLEYGYLHLDKWNLAYYSLVRRREDASEVPNNASSTGKKLH